MRFIGTLIKAALILGLGALIMYACTPDPEVPEPVVAVQPLAPPPTDAVLVSDWTARAMAQCRTAVRANSGGIPAASRDGYVRAMCDCRIGAIAAGFPDPARFAQTIRDTQPLDATGRPTAAEVEPVIAAAFGGPQGFQFAVQGCEDRARADHGGG